jgi:nicotinamide riboside transporter PnuC
MLPTLTTHSPTPSSISFLTSNKRHPKSLLVSRLRATARVVLISYALLIDLAKAQTLFDLPRHLNAYIDFLLKVTLTNPLVYVVAGYADWWVLGLLTVGTLYVCLRRNYIGVSNLKTF